MGDVGGVVEGRASNSRTVVPVVIAVAVVVAIVVGYLATRPKATVDGAQLFPALEERGIRCAPMAAPTVSDDDHECMIDGVDQAFRVSPNGVWVEIGPIAAAKDSRGLLDALGSVFGWGPADSQRMIGTTALDGQEKGGDVVWVFDGEGVVIEAPPP